MKLSSLRFLVPLAVFASLPLSRAAATAASPAALPDDAPPKIHRTVPLHFPLRMLRDGVKRGEARVLVQIDPAGALTDALAIAYTQPAFAEEAVQTIKQWRFEPLRMKGENISTVMEIAVSFKIDGVVAIERLGTPQVDQSFSARGETGHEPRGLKNLDRIPSPSHVVPPVYPKSWRNQGLAGLVTVDFYIDETGAVRMPTVEADPHPLLGAAAVAAVKEWRFEPPVFKGQPVIAHVRQVFSFSPDASP